MKRTPTFDQIYRTFFYNKLLENELVENEDFKIVNDSSQFQEKDQIDNFAILMIKSYGGTKANLKNMDATNLKMQIIVNTDKPQYWKMLIDKITIEVNSNWNNLSFEETEEYNPITYTFFQNFNSSNVISNVEQVSTSTRNTVQTSGNIFYTSQRIDLGINLSLFIDSEYVEMSRMTSSNFSLQTETEAFNEESTNFFKNADKGLIRQFSFSFILDDSNEAHQYLLNYFLDGGSSSQTIKIEVENLETEKEYDVLISDLKILGQVGQNGSIEITFIESGF